MGSRLCPTNLSDVIEPSHLEKVAQDAPVYLRFEGLPEFSRRGETLETTGVRRYNTIVLDMERHDDELVAGESSSPPTQSCVRGIAIRDWGLWWR